MKKMFVDNILKILGGLVAIIAVIVGALSAGYITAPPADLSLGAIPGPEVLERMFFKGGVVVGRPIIATTTTGTAATLTERDLINFDYFRVLMSNTLVGANFTYTLPASTSLRSFLSSPGQSASKCFFLYGTTSDSILLFTTGTGIDIRTASSSQTAGATAPTLGGAVGQEICFEFLRQPDDAGAPGDITAHIETYTEAD